jgi:DNA-binding response OmpR family regulator
MATVLIIATDQMIGGLLGQLADLAGHSAQFRRENEEASESVRHCRPDIVMLDAAYGRPAMELIAAASADVGASVVYFAAALPASELRRFALERHAKYFALPAGPKLLRRVLADALSDGERGNEEGWAVARYSVAAAAAAVERARLLADRAAAIRTESRLLRSERESALADCRRSYAELREAVIAYTQELRVAGVPPERALEMVRDAVRSNTAGARAADILGRELDDAVEWCLQAYYAA